jgi:predicted RND superfamily exporter protein
MVFFPIVGVLVGALWSLGFMACFGYQITILSGLIPALMVVIGISCCVYLLNRYHIEYRLINDKTAALKNVVERIGIAALVTNATTAIGFFVFYFTDTKLLLEFGLVASIGVIFVFTLALIYIPVVFSYLPAPTPQQTKHLDNTFLVKILQKFDDLAVRHPKYIFASFAVVVVASAYGVTKINAVGYIVDDIPKSAQLYKDLLFFQKNFRGVMPLEIVIDTGKKGGAQKPSNIEKIEEIQQVFEKYPEFTKPISLVELFKMANQAYYNGSPDDYRLPSAQERTFVLPYAVRSLKGEKNTISTALTDSTRRIARISYSMEDVGTKEIKRIMGSITTQIDSITAGTPLKVRYTGTTLMFLKGNQYLIDSLVESLLLGYLFVIIAMLPLFRRVKLLLLSFLANLVPQLFTAGIMGYFNIHLKPSTVLIFSIAFCISIDASIHLLNRYSQVRKSSGSTRHAASTTIIETGSSIIYAAIILSLGFAIFAASEFQGTVALGVLISITLIMGMFSTLLLLPALLVYFDDDTTRKTTQENNLEIK